MKPLRVCAVLLPLLLPILLNAADAETGIKAALNTQVEAWNRGDIPTFVDTYAEDCTFVSKHVLEGRAQLLARYKTQYPTPDAMGKLTFGNLHVKLLDKRIAIATGEWHLDRPKEGGGPVGGIFSLVFRFEHGAWRIVLDHTT